MAPLSVAAFGLPHAGALDDPVETIACPLVEPAGLSNWIGLKVVAAAESANASDAMKAIMRFIFDSLN